MPQDKFKDVSKALKGFCKAGVEVHDSICKRVSNRERELRKFVEKHDIVIFISGKDSSNGNLLYKACLQNNPNTHFVSSAKELKREWFSNNISVGICGATSTTLAYGKSCFRNTKLLELKVCKVIGYPKLKVSVS